MTEPASPKGENGQPVARPYLVKLVRDRVGQFLADSTVSYEPIPPDAHPELLRRKLMEEATEYLLDPSLGELADLLEVLRALAEVDLNISWSQVVKEGERKYVERGGFTAGVGMYAQTLAATTRTTGGTP